MYYGHLQHRPSRNGQSGYMLVVVVFLMVLLIVSSLVTLAAIKTSLKRDREEEMIHRGVQYARAIKRYYRKFGRYPPNLEALEDTNNVRFLRKRYSDPESKDGKWVVVKYGQVRFGQQNLGPGFSNNPQPGLPNVPGVTSMFGGGQGTGGQNSISTFGQNSFGQNQGGQGNQSFGDQAAGGDQSTGSFPSGDGGGDNTPSTGNTGAPGVALPAGTTGVNTNSQTGAIGGGAVIGVASSSPQESLRVVADKNHYKDWAFVYDPTLDRGGLITGPYDPKRAMGMRPGQLGQQIGQPIGTPVIGQQPGGTDQQPQVPTAPTQSNP